MDTPKPPSDTSIAPAALDYAAQPTTQQALYSPQAVGLATFLGSPIAGGIIMAMNYRRLGRLASGRIAIVGGLIATAALVGLGFALPEHSPAFLTAILPFLVMFQVAKQLQGEAVERHRRSGGKIASMWKASAIGLGCLLALMAIVIAIVIETTPSTGTRLIVGSSEIYYSGAATQADAQALGKALTDNGYFSPGHSTTVLLAKDRLGTTLKFVVNDEAGERETTLDAFAQLTEQIAPSVGGKPITLKLLNSELKEMQTRKIE